MGRRPEEPLEATPVQAGRGRLRVHEGDPVTLGHLAGGGGDARVPAADERVHLLLGDHALRFRLAQLRLALVVGEDEPDLGALEAGHALEPLVEGKGQVNGAVGDVGGDLEHRLVVDAGLRRRASHRVDDAEHDLLRLGGGRAREHPAADERHEDGRESPGEEWCHDLALRCGAFYHRRAGRETYAAGTLRCGHALSKGSSGPTIRPATRARTGSRCVWRRTGARGTPGSGSGTRVARAPLRVGDF